MYASRSTSAAEAEGGREGSGDGLAPPSDRQRSHRPASMSWLHCGCVMTAIGIGSEDRSRLWEFEGAGVRWWAGTCWD